MNNRTLKTLEYYKIIETLQGFAVSETAKQNLKKLVPLTNTDEINHALKETNDAVARLYSKGCVSFSGIKDIRASIKRLEIGSSLNALELLNISSLLNCTDHVKKYYEPINDSLNNMFELLDSASQLNNQIKKCIISEDEISDDASPELRNIRRKKALANERIHQELNHMLNSSTTRGCLQDSIITSRQGRFCLPVKAEYKSQIPGMIHDQSATGSTLFIEPASVVRLNNDIRELELKEKAEIDVILATLSSKATEYTDVLISNFNLLTQLDVIFAKAQLSRFYNCTCPVINTDGYINIKKGRHPLIDKEKVVPIDIHLGDSFNLLVVTGPNTGGKTVSLKTVGLLTLMAQSGLNIPALQNSNIAVFNNIFADIGDEQSIEQSLSTFSSHMTNTVQILKKADTRSLILFDEIGAGTDPTEGAALATAILANLHERGITTMATTHYSEIKMYALSTEGVENACCEFDVETLSPTYRLLIGIPGKSNAFAISSKLGLPKYIIDDASKRIDSDDIKFEDLVSDLENSRITIEKEREEIAQYKTQIEKLTSELQNKTKRINEQKEKIIRRANEQAAEILRDAKQYADETIKTMNKHGVSIKELEKQRSDLRNKMNKRQSKLQEKQAAPKARKASLLSDFTIGTHVRVLSMNLIGEVVSTPNTKGELSIAIGSMNTKTKITNLEIIDGYKEPSDSSVRKPAGGNGNSSGSLRVGKSLGIRPEINLLGLTVDEAIAALDKYLDDAYISKIPQVRIVHGKGTGALRNAVSAYLKGVPYVKSFRLGQIGEGDAGVTIVDFN